MLLVGDKVTTKGREGAGTVIQVWTAQFPYQRQPSADPVTGTTHRLSTQTRRPSLCDRLAR